MADCMGCNEEIPWETDECPHCGLEAPVERRWYVESYEPRLIELRESGQNELLAKKMWEAYYESLMLEDAVMVGELRRSMADFFHEISFHEGLVFLLVHDATDRQFFFCIPGGSRRAYLYTVEIGREDLELYVMEAFDVFNKSGPPEDLAERKTQLLKKVEDGELEIHEFPHIESDMWDNHLSLNPS